MIKEDLINRSPVRFLEQATNGGLKKGEIGILTSKKGLGKTAVLVQIGLDALLQEKQVIHVSFTQHASHVITWYEDIFSEMSKKKNLAGADDVKSSLIRKRVILNFHQDNNAFAHTVNTLKALCEGGICASCLIMDGIDFARVESEDLNVIKSYAKDMGIVIWASCDCDSENVKEVLQADVEKEIDAVVYLEQKADNIHMKAVKVRDEEIHDTKLKLDTKTLLMAEK
ncbi:MAG: hypothetical protein R3Y36_05325 [Spirochaetales bacterium]